MPRQNRVTPFGALIATPARGTLTGNRGCLHDEHGRIRRRYQGERWIICVLEFKGRRRPLMTPGRYTELFFLDEATALAAGHRPCAECQRDRFNLFRDTWAKANPEVARTARTAWLARTARLAATALDRCLHLERTETSAEVHDASGSRGSVRGSRESLASFSRSPVDFSESLAGVPDGTFLTADGQTAYLVLKGRLLLWTPAGYEPAPRRPRPFPVTVVTPASIVRMLAAGYPVSIHPSAFRAVGSRDLVFVQRSS
jgi:hypothetical protein